MARILVVEDELWTRQLLRAVLERSGHHVVLAANGREALTHWRRDPADLVITDIHMPEKDGMETILDLQACSPGTPIIAISGADDKLDVLREAGLVGARHTIAKPFSAAELLEVIELALGARAIRGT